MFPVISNIFHPERFQGILKRKQYFEGWYFKIIQEEKRIAMAVIPGVAMDKDGRKHAFIQVLDGLTATAVYHKFPFESFSYHPGKFEISIENNTFSSNSIDLNLPDLQGSLQFSNQFLWPVNYLIPGIMGPFTFVPKMECYHGIVSMNHEIKGTLNYKNEPTEFIRGKGYIEKDWGKSFPSAYIWMQANHFNQEDTSIKISVAKIPWLGSSFTGFIVALLHENKLIRFTTYNGSALKNCFADLHEVKITLSNNHYLLEIRAIRNQATELASPINGLMDGKISESMSSEIFVILTDKKTGNIILQDNSVNACLEVAGDIKFLTDLP
jgi:hypothetical protein